MLYAYPNITQRPDIMHCDAYNEPAGGIIFAVQNSEMTNKELQSVRRVEVDSTIEVIIDELSTTDK
jgi:hypothetical protein